MELALAYILYMIIRCILLGPLLWFTGKITDAEIGMKESFITILAAELTALPFYVIGMLSGNWLFFAIGYLSSLGVFIFLVMKATKANFFPDVMLLMAAFSLIKFLISV